jgi:hypothetical protein
MERSQEDHYYPIGQRINEDGAKDDWDQSEDLSHKFTRVVCCELSVLNSVDISASMMP